MISMSMHMTFWKLVHLSLPFLAVAHRPFSCIPFSASLFSWVIHSLARLSHSGRVLMESRGQGIHIPCSNNITHFSQHISWRSIMHITRFQSHHNGLVPKVYISTTLFLCHFDITCNQRHISLSDIWTIHLYQKHIVIMGLIIIISNQNKSKFQ